MTTTTLIKLVLAAATFVVSLSSASVASASRMGGSSETPWTYSECLYAASAAGEALATDDGEWTDASDAAWENVWDSAACSEARAEGEW